MKGLRIFRMPCWFRLLGFLVGVACIIAGISVFATGQFGYQLPLGAVLTGYMVYLTVTRWVGSPEWRWLLDVRDRYRKVSGNPQPWMAWRGRWGLFLGGLLWFSFGLVLHLLKLGNPAVLILLMVTGVPTCIAGAILIRRAWEKGLI